jgi:hypothetical protein
VRIPATDVRLASSGPAVEPSARALPAQIRIE